MMETFGSSPLKGSFLNDQKLQTIFNLPWIAFLILEVFLLAGCAPTVRLDTPEPLKADIAIKVDVYQHGAPVGVPERKISEEESLALRRRDERAGQIWGMKNDGVIVEGERGYLEILGKSGWDPSYVQKHVTEENQDRAILYNGEARDSARPIEIIEKEAGQRLRQQSYGAKPVSNPSAVSKE
jgi:hypothetical protein